MELHGGRREIEGAPGAATTVTVCLPAVCIDDAAAVPQAGLKVTCGLRFCRL